MTAVTACRTCGVEPLANARFCHGCGSPIAEDGVHAEYKQVTVLFADVVQSMDIAASVGPERLREIMAELVGRAAEVVRRYGGTVDKFTGDGIMALFGAPTALEDHALRACLAALGIQDEAKRLAVQVDDLDGVHLWMRVGLNSGEVIAGEIGSGALGYTAVGEQVGMAQRMESVAPPGGVMLSESTARLVAGAVELGELQTVHLKGAEGAVPARQLLSMGAQTQRTDVSESTLVGRGWEAAALEAMLERSIGGRGSVVGLSGPAGIGKTRLVREVVQLAKNRGVDVYSTFCESHATDIPFRVMARLLRRVVQVSGVDDDVARAVVRARASDVDPQDLLLLEDLLGIGDPTVELPRIDPDARRRRLTALINAAQVARTHPAIFVVEDVHWIDEVSESMLADFLTVVPQTCSMVLLTYRPEYQGMLQTVAGAQTVALAPLSEVEASALVSELLGSDPSVSQLGTIIAARAAGNPFFAQEITRELAERGVLVGERGDYVCHTDIGEIRVPATLQATIAARIDRLSYGAKRTLAAAAVIGFRFSSDLLTALGIDPSVDEPIGAELIDQIRFSAHPEYAFRHPLIHAVAYESQLKADRSRLHRRLAAAIEARDPESADQKAALIAEHFEAAGDFHAAYGWQMRAAYWAASRDVGAAKLAWERAIRIADAIPADDPQRAAMRIAPRTMLCGTTFLVHVAVAGERFEELRQLCLAAGDNASLAIAMAGLVIDHLYQARLREASQAADDAMALIESIGDPTLMIGLTFAPVRVKAMTNKWSDVLRWAQRVIDLAAGDPSKGNIIFGSPLAGAYASRANARYCLGQPGWSDDIRQALALARNSDPMYHVTVVAYIYIAGIPLGVLTADAGALREIEDALRIAESSGNDLALSIARMTLGIALVHRPTAAERDRGRALLAEVADVFQRRRHNLGELPLVNSYLARERGRAGGRDAAIPLMRVAVEQLWRDGLQAWGIPATGILVEALLDGGSPGELAEAEAVIERLAAAPIDDELTVRDILVLRLRALHAQAHGDGDQYRHFRDRYRERAATLEFAGHLGWADALP